MSTSTQCPKSGAATFLAQSLQEQGIMTYQAEKFIPAPIGTNLPHIIKKEERTAQSALSVKLNPPTQPELRPVVGNWETLFMVVPLLVVYGLIQAVTGNFGLAIVAGAVTMVVVTLMRVPEMKERVAKAKATFADQGQRWQRQMQVWRRMRYCSECGRVFDPETGRQVSVDNMYSVLGD